jgi:hypothetical protein
MCLPGIFFAATPKARPFNTMTQRVMDGAKQVVEESSPLRTIG